MYLKSIDILLTRSYDISMTKQKTQTSFFDLNIFGIKLKPWMGILIGVFIQMFFGGILAGIGGLLIIASIVSFIHQKIAKRAKKA